MALSPGTPLTVPAPQPVVPATGSNFSPGTPVSVPPPRPAVPANPGPPPGGLPSTTTPAPAPVEYNIANLSEPQIQSGATTAPAATMAQNQANARANQSTLGSFFGTGTGYAPQYEVDYTQQTAVQSGAAGNPT